MTRIAVSIALGLAALSPAAEPTPAQVKAAEDKLKAFRDALSKPAGILSRLDDGKVSFAAEAKDFDGKSVRKLSELLTAADKLARVADKDEKKRDAEGGRFMDVLKEAKPKDFTETVGKLARDAGAVKFGVVGEATDAGFKLSATVLVKDPADAKKRIADWVKAMDEQAKRLDAAAKDLKTIADRAKANREALAKIDGKVKEFNRLRLNGDKDLVNRKAVDEYFEFGLLQKYDRLKENAEAAAKKATDAKVAQDSLLKAVQDKVRLLDAK